MKTRRLCGWYILVALAGLPACIRSAAAPFGAADFLPSPTSTVGFAGQGNNW